MKIDKFNQHLVSRYAFKDKEQLDEMSKEEIRDYRSEIVQTNGGYTPKDITKLSLKRQCQMDWKSYLNELELYELIRFKQDTFDMYDKWIKQAAESDPNDHSTDVRTVQLLASILNKENGREVMYNMSLKSDLEKIVDEPKYILGMEYDKDKIDSHFTNGKI